MYVAYNKCMEVVREQGRTRWGVKEIVGLIGWGP